MLAGAALTVNVGKNNSRMTIGFTGFVLGRKQTNQVRPLFQKIPSDNRIIARSQDRGDYPYRQIPFGFPKTMDAGAEAGEGDFWRGIHFSETRHDHLFINFSVVVPMKTAGETPDRLAGRRICQMLSSGSPERMSNMTPLLPISGSSDCVLFHK
jgi:hypothetical protein